MNYLLIGVKISSVLMYRPLPKRIDCDMRFNSLVFNSFIFDVSNLFIMHGFTFNSDIGAFVLIFT